MWLWNIIDKSKIYFVPWSSKPYLKVRVLNFLVGNTYGLYQKGAHANFPNSAMSVGWWVLRSRIIKMMKESIVK